MAGVPLMLCEFRLLPTSAPHTVSGSTFFFFFKAGICSMFVYRQRLMNPVSVLSGTRKFDDDGKIVADCFKTPGFFSLACGM